MIKLESVIFRILAKRQMLGITDAYDRKKWCKEELSFQRQFTGHITYAEIGIDKIELEI